MANKNGTIKDPSTGDLIYPITYTHNVYDSNNKNLDKLLEEKANTSEIPTGAAANKNVVTTVDSSNDLPTSNAVKTFVEGKGYITSSGSITGNATTATKATQDSDGKTIKNTYTKLDGSNNYLQLYGETSSSNTTGWRLIATATPTALTWINHHLTMTVASRHSGNGLLSIAVRTGSSINNFSASIHLYGATDTHVDKNAWKLIFNKTTGESKLYWRYRDWGYTNIKILGRAGFSLPTLGAWQTATPTPSADEVEILTTLHNSDPPRLVKEFTLSTASSAVDITGLDLLADGGVYEVICDLKVNVGADINLQINNITTATYHGFMLLAASGDFRELTTAGSAGIVAFPAGLVYSEGAVLSFKLVQTDTTKVQYLFDSHAPSGGTVFFRNGGGRVPTTSSVTSFRVLATQPLQPGTKIKIYRKAK